GRAGKTRVSVDLRTGISDPTRQRDFLNAGQYRELFSEAVGNAGWLQGATPQQVWESYIGTDDWTQDHDTDWAAESFQQGNVNEANISLSGGNEKTMVYLSSGYNDQKGILNANRYNRANVLANLDHSISKKIKLGLKLSLSKSTNYRLPDDNAFANPIQLNAIPPIQPVIDPETGEYNPYTFYDNNLRNIEGTSSISKQFRSLNGLDLSYEVIPGLFWRSDFSLDFVQLAEDLYWSENTTDGAPTGYGYNNQTRVSNFNTNHTLSYSRVFEDRHDLQILGGFSYQEASSFRTATEGRGFPNAQFKRIASASVVTDGLTEEDGYNFVSFFARANYKFNDRYLLGASARVDGSSRFGKDNRFGVFPAVSAGWILSREGFLDGSGMFLKLRASYGITGNSEIDNFASRSLWSSLPYADQAGIVFDQIGVDALSWEKNKQFDLGLDFGFAANRITGEIDYFNKRSDGLLLDFQLPGTNGFTVITKNVGSMENKGWEFGLTSDNLVREFKWTTTFNISTYRNKVLDMNGTVINPDNMSMGKVEAGKPFGYFYGRKYAGVNPENGNARYFEEDGTMADQGDHSGYEQMVGNPHPDFYGGFGNRFSYKGFDLDILAQFVYGNDIYNMAGVYQSVNGNGFDNQTADQMDYWRKPGDVTDIPQPRLGESNGAGKSSRWVEKGSYLRIKNVVLGYNLPSGILERHRIAGARIYISAQNLITITGYSGYDPEVNSYIVDDVHVGHDFYTAPQLRTIALGINVDL
ncbi:MAG TPA: SusC/RagA family TonB-linked outer membrane protein, partial [Anseongella sp.]|nr:SusC/RagA family TonB-linked outer membrane protein [Anseongella sp.]